ncbi:unnamed protein product [Plutella xylostella]|uniref:(diamondback moth) hypothetical protein n=1 Tax=Plutella xylostella TaxID=51655 RepID=A0A8S4DMQ0_PLUXY|nr:unnamed protein product [Plutella xylostella]
MQTADAKVCCVKLILRSLHTKPADPPTQPGGLVSATLFQESCRRLVPARASRRHGRRLAYAHAQLPADTPRSYTLQSLTKKVVLISCRRLTHRHSPMTHVGGLAGLGRRHQAAGLCRRVGGFGV